MKLKCSIVLFLCISFLTGCATSDWNSLLYGNPQGQQAQPQGYGAICEICGRSFVITADTAQQSQQVKCPYCEHVQNIESAINRYSYALQQQSNAVNQQFWQNMQEINREHAQRTQEILSKDIYRRQEPSRLHTNTNCSPDGIGGYYCNTYNGIGNGSTTTRCSPDGIGGFRCSSY